MKADFSRRAKELDSEILAVGQIFFEWVIRLTMGSVYRLFGVPKEKITLHHAELFLVITTGLIIGLICGAQFWGPLGWFIIVLGNVRILQIISLNLNTILFDMSPVGEVSHAVKKARWHFVAIGFSFLDTVMIFAFMYQFFDHRYLVLNEHASDFFHYLYYSVMTITTIGYGDIHPITVLGRVVVMYEAMVALMFLVFFVTGAVGRLQRHV